LWRPLEYAIHLNVSLRYVKKLNYLNDFSWQIVGDRTVCGEGPTAVCWRTGYNLFRSLPASAGKTSHDMHVIVAHVSDATDLSRFWSIE